MATISKLPVLPLVSAIVFPSGRAQVSVSSNIGEALIEKVHTSENPPVVAAIAITTPATVISKDEQLAPWGTASRVIRIVKPRGPGAPYLVILQGLTRVRLTHAVVVNSLSTPLAEYEVEYPAPEKTPSKETVAAFKASALRLLDRKARESTHPLKRDGFLKIASMMDDLTDQRAAWMADVLIGSLDGEYADKMAVLSTADAEARLAAATAIFTKYASISEVTTKIASAVDETLSKQQKEFYLRQQLAAINRELSSLNKTDNGGGSVSELDDDEQHEADDLADLKAKIEAMGVGSEERKMGVREWRRLKRIPAGSVENGVIRSYLEWLTSVPWPNSTALQPSSSASLTDRNFLANARAQLDADHFGLEKIKKRLIEYLAVVRLKQMNAAREEAASAALTRSSSDPVAETVESSENMDKALVPFNPDATDKLFKSPSPAPSINSNSSGGKKKGVKGPILLFVGPPGTGKTSLGQSVARALSRPFQRISLGGVRDEAEIRGHRRTYVASGPGLIVQALRKAGRSDPVILLDEIDKIGQGNFHGDPGAALLEVLDPEQNHTFNDHYINVPIDLSQVLFICTSNTLDTISAPLLDRCEIVQLSGYTYDEKMHIARRFLLPKQLTANGLDESHVTISEPALLTIATQYTHEAGVRSLERAIGTVVRHKAVEWAEHIDTQSDADVVASKTTDRPTLAITDGSAGISDIKPYKRVVDEDELEAILGISRWDEEDTKREERRGVVYGLVVMGGGEGGTLPVETIALPGTGALRLTGSLGDVIKESGELALSWVKMHAYELGITNTRSQDPLKVPHPIDIHLHLPAGATKKDGPSAGIAMTCAFVSLLTGACVPSNVAMTGEITLRGRVTPVGGIKEKVLGAHRAHVTKLILPWANRKDVEHDVALEVRNQIEFVFVRTVREGLDAAFGKDILGWRNDGLLLESRL